MNVNPSVTEFMAVERDGELHLEPLTKCMYCLGDHLLDGCPEKYDCFGLTYNDERFLEACGIFYPSWIDGKFVGDPLRVG
jgi:hypothetical protein